MIHQVCRWGMIRVIFVLRPRALVASSSWGFVTAKQIPSTSSPLWMGGGDEFPLTVGCRFLTLHSFLYATAINTWMHMHLPNSVGTPSDDLFPRLFYPYFSLRFFDSSLKRSIFSPRSSDPAIPRRIFDAISSFLFYPIV